MLISLPRRAQLHVSPTQHKTNALGDCLELLRERAARPPPPAVGSAASSFPPPASWLESSSWPPASRTCCSGAAEGTGCASASTAHRRGGAGLLPALSSWRLELFAQLLLAAGFVPPWDSAGGRRMGQGMAGGSSLLGEGSQGVLTSISSSKMNRTSSVIIIILSSSTF